MSKNYQLLLKAFLVTFIYLTGVVLIISFFNFFPFFDNKFLNINELLIKYFRWDSYYYLSIALDGYQSISSVFFPLYPFLIKLFAVLFGFWWAGFLVSWLALALSVFVFYKLLALRYSDEKNIYRTIILLLFSPFALFLTAYYTESLFLLLSLSFFYFLKTKRWFLASAFAFFASLTKNIGIVLLIVYLYEYWCLYKTKFNRSLVYSLLIILGPVSYLTFCYFTFNNPFSFISEQANWTQHEFSMPWQNFYKYLTFSSDLNLTNYFYIYVHYFREFASFLIMLIAVIYFIKKREWSYGLYGLILAIIFSSVIPLTSVNRYVIIFFPIYIFLNELFKKDWSWFVLLYFTFIYYVFNLAMFSRGDWIG